MAEVKMTKRNFKSLKEFVQSIRNRKNDNVHNVSNEDIIELTDEELDNVVGGVPYDILNDEQKNAVNNVHSKYDRELTDEELDYVIGGVPADAIAEHLHDKDVSGIFRKPIVQEYEEIYNETHDIQEQKDESVHAEDIDYERELTDEELDLVRGGVPAEAIADYLHDKNVNPIVQEYEEIYKENHDIVIQKRIKDVVFIMHPTNSNAPAIDVMYVTDDGNKYMPIDVMNSGGNPKEISRDAGYIARKFNPHTNEFVEPVIYDPENNGYDNNFKGHYIINNEGVREIHDDYIAGYRLDYRVALSNEISYEEKVDAMFRKMCTCMSSSQNLDLINKFNFRFFANDKELVNIATISDRNEEMAAWERNQNIVNEQFQLTLNQEETKHM